MIYLTGLREYQKSAIKYIESYLNKKSGDKQCLVKMPTGTGKSVVISVVSQFIKNKNCIIIVPSIALKTQIMESITEKTWNNLDYHDKLPKEVIEVTSSNINSVVENQSPTVLVASIQSLLKIKKNNIELYKKLKRKIDFSIFDEGHREAASEWSNVVRELSKKVVLFSATPVRNDERVFEFGKNIFQFSYQEADRIDVVRKLEFRNITDKAKDFVKTVKNVIENYKDSFQISEKDFQIIIRCETKSQIIDLTNSLNENGIISVGIHDSFKNTNNLYREYSLINNREQITCFLHQYKLVEGIDNNKFSILIFFSSYKNGRSIIQQVGRILRKSSEKDHRTAWVFSYTEKEKNTWANYLNYEENLIDDGNFNYDQYHTIFLKSLPSAIYNKDFLSSYKSGTTTFDLNRYKIPKISNVFQSSDSSITEPEQFQIALNLVESYLLGDEYVVLEKNVNYDKKELVVIYSSYSFSKYLVKEIYIEPTLEIVILKVINNRLFYFNTLDRKPESLGQHWRRVDGSLLTKMFQSTTEFQIASVKNGSITTNNFNRMTINAEDISRMVPDPADKFNLLTVVKGKFELENGEMTSRYIGFNNGRISENNEIVGLENYLKWIEEINHLFNATETHSIFDRYAPITLAPNNTDPVAITFYFDDDDPLTDSFGNKIDMKSKTSKVESNSIKLTINEKEYDISIAYLPITNEYHFSSFEKIPAKYNDMDLIDFINKNQNFLVMLPENDYRFYNGQFYKLGVPVDYKEIKKLVDHNKLLLPDGAVINEKGKYYKNASNAPKKVIWDPYSLFYIIATQGKDIRNNSQLKRILMEADYIVCSDLNKEIADFIVVSDSANEVSFIHCKAGDSKLSASAFQEVCGQINKNLDYVHNASTREPRDLHDWDSPLGKQYWFLENYGVTIDRKIINKGDKTAKEIWELLKKIQLRENSITNVIAFIGTSFSMERYEKEITKPIKKQSPEKIQIDYILLETAIAVGRAQANFIVSYIE